MLIVQMTEPNVFVELFPFANGRPTTIVAGDPPVRWPWSITNGMSDEALNALGIWRVEPAEVPDGQMAIGYHFEMRDGVVVQIVDELQDVPIPLPSFGEVVQIAEHANQRIDAGTEAGLDAVRQMKQQLGMLEGESFNPNQAVNKGEFKVLLDGMQRMFEAQLGKQPR